MGECYYYGACLYTSNQMAHEAGPKIRDILEKKYPREWEADLGKEGDESGILYIEKSSVYFQLEVSHMQDWGELLHEIGKDTVGMTCASWCSEENVDHFDYLELLNERAFHGISE
jgi:hypothetical protein